MSRKLEQVGLEVEENTALR